MANQGAPPPAVVWRVELLGGLRAVRLADGRAVGRFRTRRAALLMAYLALNRDAAHGRDFLTEMLWPDADCAAGRARLKQELSSLRRQLEPPGVPAGTVLAAPASAGTVRLDPRTVETDVAAFEAAFAAAPADAAALERAASLYRGELLPGSYEDWVLRERERLRDAYVSLLERWAEACAAAGDRGRALEIARRALASDPYREPSHAALIRLLVADGQAAEARRRYAALAEMLRDEYGEEPSPDLAALLEGAPAAALPPQQRRRGGGGAPGRSTTAATPVASSSSVAPRPLPPAAAPGPVVALPAVLSAFFGRHAELDRLAGWLGGAGDGPARRLVTAVGPGGVGKTRLAVEAARRAAAAFPAGVAFVPLADLPVGADADRLWQAVADALLLPADSKAPAREAVLAALSAAAPRRLLLLDNAEHVAEPLAAVTAGMLAAAPGLWLLVTSRRPLLVPGEQQLPLAPLPTPPAAGTPERLLEFPSVALFVDRAQAALPDFQITPRGAAAVAQLCDRLEGLPLAIELAAAWVPVLSPRQIAERLGSRFELLVGRPATFRRDAAAGGVPARHRSLRAALEWSLALLPPDLRAFFLRLSVFRGGFPPEAAGVVAAEEGADEGTVLDALLELARHSLVGADAPADEAAPGGGPRFRLLESLRELAESLLTQAERDELRRRHARWCRELLGAPDLRDFDGPDARERLAMLERERQNLDAALEWTIRGGGAREDRGEAGLRLARRMLTFWNLRGPVPEGRRWLEEALENGADAPALHRAHAYNSLGALANLQGDRAAARQAMERSVALLRDLGEERDRVQVLCNLAVNYAEEGELDAAQGLTGEALGIAEKCQDQRRLAEASKLLATIAFYRGDVDAAEPRMRSALAAYRALGDQRSVAFMLNSLAGIAYVRADWEEATRLLTESAALFEQIGDRLNVGNVLGNLGNARLHVGDAAGARRHLARALALERDSGDGRRTALLLEAFGALGVVEGEHALCPLLWGAAETIRDRVNAPLLPSDRADNEEWERRAVAALGGAAFVRLTAEGRRLTLDEALARVPGLAAELAACEAAAPDPAAATPVAPAAR